jgi:hypothetical protein
MATSNDFTKLGLKLEGAWENDRNSESRDMFKAIIKEVYGATDIIIAHHIAYAAKERRKADDGVEYDHEIIEEIPSADCLIFDHEAARKLWGKDHYLNVLARLAMEPPESRDKLMGEMLQRRSEIGNVPSEFSGDHAPVAAYMRLLPCGMGERRS